MVLFAQYVYSPFFLAKEQLMLSFGGGCSTASALREITTFPAATVSRFGHMTHFWQKGLKKTLLGALGRLLFFFF